MERTSGVEYWSSVLIDWINCINRINWIRRMIDGSYVILRIRRSYNAPDTFEKSLENKRLICQSLLQMTATPPPLLVPARSFLKRMYPLRQTKCEGILLLSHVSETKQMSILLEWSSAWRAEAVSGLARDRAFIIMQWGIILGADSPSLSAKSTTVSVRWLPLLRSWLASWMQLNWQKKPRRMVRKFHYTLT